MRGRGGRWRECADRTGCEGWQIHIRGSPFRLQLRWSGQHRRGGRAPLYWRRFLKPANPGGRSCAQHIGQRNGFRQFDRRGGRADQLRSPLVVSLARYDALAVAQARAWRSLVATCLARFHVRQLVAQVVPDQMFFEWLNLLLIQALSPFERVLRSGQNEPRQKKPMGRRGHPERRCSPESPG